MVQVAEFAGIDRAQARRILDENNGDVNTAIGVAVQRKASGSLDDHEMAQELEASHRPPLPLSSPSPPPLVALPIFLLPSDKPRRIWNPYLIQGASEK